MYRDETETIVAWHARCVQWCHISAVHSQLLNTHYYLQLNKLENVQQINQGNNKENIKATYDWLILSLNFTDSLSYASWWRHQTGNLFALLAICAGNLPVTGEFPAQKPVTWSFDVFFDLRLNERLSKQSWGWWFETPLRPLWRQSNRE